jgi:hypothetical protein
MIGGVCKSFTLELLLYPALYEIWRWHLELKHQVEQPGSAAMLRTSSDSL